MKYNFMLLPGLLLAQVVCTAQSPCITVKIQTAAVARPTVAQVSVINDCTERKLSWRGKAGQTYAVSLHSQPLQTFNAVCDKGMNCEVILPVTQGQPQQYSIIAEEVIDQRVFFSYPLQGTLPSCDAPITLRRSAPPPGKGPVEDFSTALQLYPNPVTGQLTLKWKSNYQGPAKISIIDATGKTVQQLAIRKAVPDYLEQITVRMLSPGLYFLNIQMQNGEMVSTRFVKE